jgi:hypothetical protein
LAGLGHGVAATRVLLESLLSSLDNFVERADVYLPELAFEVAVDYAVELAQHLPQL